MRPVRWKGPLTGVPDEAADPEEVGASDEPAPCEMCALRKERVSRQKPVLGEGRP